MRISRRVFLAATAAIACQGRHPAPASTAAAAAASTPASASRPAEVLLMRHAEKPDRDSDEHLSKRGTARAAALVHLFPAPFAAPTLLFAARESKASNRSVETLEPLAQALHLRIDDTYESLDYGRLAKTILSRADCVNARILICWHHETLPELAKALGAQTQLQWPDKQYDRIWQIRYGPEGAVLKDVPQRLMPGDTRNEP